MALLAIGSQFRAYKSPPQQSVDSNPLPAPSRPWPGGSLRMHSLNAEPKLCTHRPETGGYRVAIEWRYVALVAVG